MKKIFTLLTLLFTLILVTPITTKAYSEDPLDVNDNDRGCWEIGDEDFGRNKCFYGYYGYAPKTHGICRKPRVFFTVYCKSTDEYVDFYCNISKKLRKHLKNGDYVKIYTNNNRNIVKIVKCKKAKKHLPTKRLVKKIKKEI